MIKNQTEILLLICAICFFMNGAANAWSSDELKLENKYLHPGKIDFHYTHTRSTDEYNTFLWSPGFKGGEGYIHNDNGKGQRYSGGYIRPLLPENGKGELILGFLDVDSPTTNDYEFQGEYRFPFGLGFGGGFVTRENAGNDISFEKISFRNKIADWNYIVSTQFQETEHEESPGGYLGLYDESKMFVYGNDGEQWRGTFGYITPDNKGFFQPALETLFVDNSIGKFDGTKFLFINGTLKYQGGFLSHAARLGRAMGPTGLEYGNPLGFLTPTWNRRLDVWEIGGLANFRVDRVKSATGVVTERYEGLIYPFQFDSRPNAFLDSIYLGGFHSRSWKDPSEGALAGVFGKWKSFLVGVGADYNFDTNEKRILSNVILKF